MSKPARASRNEPSLVMRLAAELGIIVLGVLIALWADGWVSERAERRTETARIQALLANVVATRERIAAAREDAEFASEALALLTSAELRQARAMSSD